MTGRRVLLLSHSPNNPNGGASRVFHLLAGGLESLGHEVDLLHLEDMEVPSNKLAALVSTRTMMPKLLARAGRRREAASFDVVVSPSGIGYELYRGLAGTQSRPLLVNLIHGLAKYDHAAYMAESHVGHWPVSLQYRAVTGPMQVRWDDAGIRASDVTVVQNLRDLSDVRHLLGDASRVALIEPAIHPQLLAASSRIAPIDVRDPGALLWFGTWEARKGAHYVPAAFREISRSHPAATLTLGGTGCTEADLLARFDPVDRARVRVLGRISNEEQAEVFQAASIFLFPSLSEGFGLALAEAMCFGLAAVTTSTAFGGDHLTEGVDARIVPTTSTHIARAVIDLIGDPVTRAKLATRGRDIARAFTVERSAGAYAALFDERISAPRSLSTPAGPIPDRNNK